MLWPKWTGLPRPSGLSSQIGGDSLPTVRAICNVQSMHPPIPLAIYIFSSAYRGFASYEIREKTDFPHMTMSINLFPIYYIYDTHTVTDPWPGGFVVNFIHIDLLLLNKKIMRQSKKFDINLKVFISRNY